MRFSELLVALLFILGIILVVSIFVGANLRYIGSMSIQGTTVYVYELGYQYYLCTQRIDPPCFLTSNTLVCNSGSCVRASYIYNGNVSR